MASQAFLNPEELQAAISDLRHAVDLGRGRRSAQKKTELAALLYEAHRIGAYRKWGFAHLGQYTAQVLKMNPKTFSKYKDAGKALFTAKPAVYAELMAAIATSGTRPQLPEVSELANTASLHKQVGDDDTLYELRERGVALGKVNALAAEQTYGAASRRGREVLSSLDAFVASAHRLKNALLELPTEEDIPSEQRKRRLDSIRSACEAVLDALEQASTCSELSANKPSSEPSS